MSAEPVFDLRSDTVTRPGRAMREAMASAAVGDDVYGEDPTVIELERRVAELLGKDSALFVPSGTMSNQIALLVHTRPGDEVVIGEGAHIAFYESGAGAALAGVQFAEAGAGGLFDAEELSAVVKPQADYHPRTSLVCLENTHNRAGGRIFPQATLESVVERARQHGLSAHLDGARLWHASIATGVSEAELARPFDTVSVCFSKGLGAPVGSALAGAQGALRAARRYRKMLGGGMRQAGILAAGALFALEHHVARLKHDHDNAKALARGLDRLAGIDIDPYWVETNLVYFALDPEHCALDAERFCAALLERGVRMGVYGPRLVRAVTHIDVHANDIDAALAAVEAVLADAA